MFVTDVTISVPPDKFTVPTLLKEFPLAFLETSSVLQLITPVPLTVSVPVPRLATKNGPLPPLMFMVPPLTLTSEISPELVPLAPWNCSPMFHVPPV